MAEAVRVVAGLLSITTVLNLQAHQAHPCLVAAAAQAGATQAAQAVLGLRFSQSSPTTQRQWLAASGFKV
jgi:hypothetical protein